jgi:16S rRNA (guanine1516-N2)-methyltransferase
MVYYISCQSGLESDCQLLIQRFGFAYSDSVFPRLHLEQSGLKLFAEANLGQSATDFLLESQRQGKDLLAKAVLAKQGSRVLDLSGGWGRDAQVMLAAGAKVTCLEQHPYMAAILEELAARLAHPHFSAIWTEASTYLNALETEFPEVIYYDPMHPERQKSAKVKKPLQILQALIPPATDVVKIIQLARYKAQKRVVVKWPSKAEKPLKPHFSLGGKTIDYDVFLANP